MARKSQISVFDVLPAVGFAAVVAYAVVPVVWRTATQLLAWLR